MVASFALRRDALAALLENADFHVVARSRDLRAALRDVEAGSLTPALVLTDLRTWSPQDLKALAGIRELHSATKVVVLVDQLKPLVTQQLLSSGVEGFLTPDIHEAALLRYLELVLLGERLYHPDIRTPGPEQAQFSFPNEGKPGTTRLSTREGQVLRLLAGGIGTVPGAILGALIIFSIINGLVLMGTSSAVQQIALGLVLISAVAFDVTYTKYVRDRG